VGETLTIAAMFFKILGEFTGVGYPASLEVRELYQCIPDQNASRIHQLRVIDESGEDYLYPEELFVPVQLPHSSERAVLRAR
jgi:hypothetical protein